MLTGVAALGVAVALLGCGAHFYPARRAWSLGVVAAAPYLMLAGPVSAALFGLAGQWAGLAVALVVAAMCLGTQLPMWMDTRVRWPGRELVVMTANLWLGRADPAAVVRAVRNHDVEVLMLEEVTPELHDHLLAAGLADLLPHHESRAAPAAAGIDLWSRYPLTVRQVHDGFLFPFITARVQLPGTTAPPTAGAVHLAGPVPDATRWRLDVARLAVVLAALPADAPVVVGGDFNATPDTVQFRAALASGYRTAGRSAGAGHLRSWPAHRWYRPLIAIDHVIVRGGTARTATTVPITGSDHRALLTRLALPTR
jgi:endonuclease/exonuclease/phosphatase (EEP) superfamily protein YafD